MELSLSPATREIETPAGPPPPPSIEARRLMEWARIRSRIETLRNSARNIAIDGDARDWDGFFWSRCTVSRPRDGAPMPLLLAIAPTEREILFCLRSESPDPGWWKPWRYLGLTIDVQSPDWDSVMFTLRPGQSADGESRAWAWIGRRSESERARVPRGGVRHVWGECIEGLIDLAAFHRDGHGATLDGIRAILGRPWLRVCCELIEADDSTESVQDASRQFGPDVASYRLSPEDFAPSWADRTRHADAARGTAFLRGRWFVVAGHDHWKSHLGRYAYDFRILDQRGSPYLGRNRGGNEASLSWNCEVLAPRDGFLGVVSDDKPDREFEGGKTLALTIPELEEVREQSNWVALYDGAHHWRFAHLRQGSAPTRSGNHVGRGELIARVGNSGSVVEPHLHVDAFRQFGGRTVPLILEDVVVGLNASDDDPWEVTLPEWEVEAGYFVRGAASPR